MKPPDFSIVLPRRKLLFPTPITQSPSVPAGGPRDTPHSRPTKCPRGQPPFNRAGRPRFDPHSTVSAFKSLREAKRGTIGIQWDGRSWKRETLRLSGGRKAVKGSGAPVPAVPQGFPRPAPPRPGPLPARAPPRPGPGVGTPRAPPAARRAGCPGRSGRDASQVRDGAAGGPALRWPGAGAAIVSARPPRAPGAARPRSPALAPLSVRPAPTSGGGGSGTVLARGASGERGRRRRRTL